MIGGVSLGVTMDKNSRTILFHCDVNEDNIADLNQHLINFIHEDDKKELEVVGFERDPIHLHINSYGGTVPDMRSTVSIMRTTKTPIYTYCEGYAQSAGFILFISGDKRVVYEGAELMYHSLSCGVFGKYQEMSERMDNIEIINKRLERYTISRTNISQEMLDEVREKKQDLYIYDDKSLELGCADEVIHFIDE